MVLNKDEITTFLAEQKEYFKQAYGVQTIALFGSYARGEQTETSDIDIAIVMDEHAFFKRWDMREFLEGHFHKKVDLVYLDTMRSYIRATAEKDLVYV